MYCSSCGGAVARGLAYCNHCGASLNGAKSNIAARPAELFPDSLVWAIVTVFIVGLGCTIGLMAVMKDVFGPRYGLIMGFTLLSLLMTLMVEGILIWLLLSRKRDAGRVDDTERLKEHTTKGLAAPQPHALPEPLPSVTEHTTRAFEPIQSKRKSN